MKTGHAISCFMLRQMEYDADSYEVKVAGTDAFAETSARMRELGLLSHVGHGELREAWLRRTVPSNLPAFVLQQHGRFSPEDLGRVRAVPEAKTETFDTHPSDADRIRAASNPRLPGILIGGLPVRIELLAAIGMPEDAGVKAEEGVVLARTGATRYNLIGRLAAIALRVEAAMGSSVVEGGK